MSGVNDVSANLFRCTPYEVMKQALHAEMKKSTQPMDSNGLARTWIIQLRHSPYYIDYLHQFHLYTLEGLGGRDKIIHLRPNPYRSGLPDKDPPAQIDHLG